MEYVLTADHLSKRYRNCKALDNLSMRVEKGAIYGFVGKNGAGKTTLIRIICGLQSPSSGTYTLYGKPHTDKNVGEARRRMGAIVETPSIYQSMTAEENLRAQYRVLGRPSFSDIGDLLALVGLKDTGSKKARNFSLGMRQRLGIAVALAGNPDFLTLDEPANGLDPQGIVEMRELILKLHHEFKITVLISSHILDELSRLATHYGFIDGGRIVREISAKELDAACRKCMRVTVSDIKAMARVLDGLNIEYTVLSDQEADIFGQQHATELALALSAGGCDILTFTTRDETLESYYINLIGGGNHA